MSDKKDAVLFACNQNAIRSPMAEALFRHARGAVARVDSCGLYEGVINPFTVAVMSELGVDLSGHQAKSFDVLRGNSFALVVALTPESHVFAREFVGEGAAVEYWETPDPTLAEGHREARMAAFRQVRDMLLARIEKKFG